jgi:hypothetical protein
MIAPYIIPISSSSSTIHPGLEGANSKQKRKEMSARKMFRTATVGYLTDKSGSK